MRIYRIWNGQIGALAFIAVLGTVCTVGSTHRTSRSAQARIHEAQESLEEGDAAGAIGLLRSGIAADPECAELHGNLALVYGTCKLEAAEILGVTLPELYFMTLKEAAEAAKLRPADVDFARVYAYWSMDAEQYGASTDLDVAFEAWTNYLAAHLEDEAMRRDNPVNHPIATYGILLRLAKIEVKRGNPGEATEYVQKALALDIVDPVFTASRFLEEFLQAEGMTAEATNSTLFSCE